MESVPNSDQAMSHSSNARYRFGLVVLTSLFFMWGFITCLNDILIPYLKGLFSLSYTQAMLIQFCFFSAYFIVSLPAGRLVGRIGYKNGIVTGLGIACVGCVLFIPAAIFQIYALFLAALFVLASGITILQVSANPYVTALGPAETASSRLTMTQAFNSLGTTVAPFFGAFLLFSHGEGMEATVTGEEVQIPYLILATALAALAITFLFLKLPKIQETEELNVLGGSAWSYRHLVLGAVGIFVYVGAEVSIGSFLVNFIGQDDTMGLGEGQASKLIALYWGGAMVGRFIGAAVMQKVPAGKVLTFNAGIAIFLLLVCVSASGPIAVYAVLGVGLFNSIMFPTIFSLALKGLGKHTAQGSGILCLAIVGGAIVPLLQGALADSIGVQLAFLLPAVCYLYIAFYGVKGHKPEAA